MKMVKHLIYYMNLLAAVLLMAACADNETVNNEEPLPEGYGRIRIAICAPENAQTRAVNAVPWEDPDHDWEKLQNFRIYICNASNNQVVDIIKGTRADMTGETGEESTYNKISKELQSGLLTAGDYHIFATANFNSSEAATSTANANDAYDDGISIGSTIDPANNTFKFTNGYSEKNIPMTGKLTNADGTLKSVTVYNAKETDAGVISVWRVMGKLQFYFTNEASEEIKVYGIEVEPINQASSVGPGVYLFSHDDLTSTKNLAPYGVDLVDPEDNTKNLPTVTLPPAPSGENKKSAREDVGKVIYEKNVTPADPLLTLAAKNDGNTDEGTFFFYVNESDATYTVTQNQFSLRFKIKRGDGTEEELRYGMTTPYVDGTTGKDGFNVIRRNDWIHIPIVLTDWQFRIEPLAFVPIAGYPAKTLSSDALTATFSTGGMIALQPFVKKKNDKSWRDYGDPRITNLSISWKNSDGENIAYYNSDGTVKDGDTTDESDKKIVKTAFEYDSVTKSIIGELDNTLPSGTYKTTFTVNAQLDNYPYSFTFNVILQK